MRKTLLLLLLGLGLQFPVFGQEPGFLVPSVNPQEDAEAIARVRARMDSIRQYRPTVALVLGGGGARGLAHLGVLRYLEELGIPVDMVGGTSMGGLVSGLYSLGYNAKELDSLVRSIDWSVMMSDRVPDNYQSYKVRRLKERFALTVPFHYEDEDLAEKLREEALADQSVSYDARSSEMGEEALRKIGLGIPDGFLFGFNIRNLLTSVSVGYQDSLRFDNLPIPYFCVATDMTSMKAKHWTQGKLVDAMRSTMAIPMYFRPIRTGGMVLSDGGTRNNFPVDMARAMGADIVIGSEMGVVLEHEDLGTLSSLALQNIVLFSVDADSRNREDTDILIQHTLEGYTTLSFDEKSVAAIIDEGYQDVLKYKDALEAVARLTAAAPSAARARPAVNIGRRKVKIRNVEFSGITDKERRIIEKPWLFPKDSLAGKAEIEAIMSLIYGTRTFESVTYRLEGAEEPYDLVFECQKGQTSELGFGLHLDTDEMISLGVRVGLGTRKLYGSRFQTELKVGNNGYLLLDYSYRPSLPFIPVVGASLSNHYVGKRFTGKDGVQSWMENIQTKAELYVEDRYYPWGTFRVGYDYETEPFEHFFSTEEVWTGWDLLSRFHSLFANFSLDTFNDGYYPTSGLRAGLNVRGVFRGYSTYIYEEDQVADEHTEGFIEPYVNGLASLSWAGTIGRVTFQPSAYLTWTTGELGHIYAMHTPSAGGTLVSRYEEYQIPFFGYSNTSYYMDRLAAMAQMDVRYSLNRKASISAQGAVLHSAGSLSGFVSTLPSVWAAGLSFGYRTVGGPLDIGLHWCNETGPGFSLSYGFVF